ncbi:MAG: bifunctional folylpolyglutamate synthase/dihydrofolate synthase, partial [Clostridia bacterium]|nr:bifunctional folylpolyglutamate synthase/dihydrofolate synthase [Clostridia bacterium]
MNYQETVQYLNECARLGSRPGLTAVRELLRRLGNPQNVLKFVHIAGTNGKGSVASFAASILSAAGYQTGFFASPWVYRLTETVCINQQEIAEADFAAVMSRVRIAADKMPQEGFSHPTEFELLTAAAYLYFAESGCDFVVVEAGMGGRLDATNVIDTTLVSVLTKIEYDHLGFLGNSLTDITREKCGIFRKSRPVAIYPFQEDEVFDEIKEQAIQNENILCVPDVERLCIHNESLLGSEFSYKAYEHVHISLCGRHQIYNAITAIEAIEALADGAVCTSKVIEGLANTRWQGRFEVLAKEPPVILDGAHNVNGAKACVDTVLALQPGRDFIGVIGMLRDKDYKTCFALFSQICSRFIIAEVPNARAEKTEILAEAARSTGAEVLVEKVAEQAVRKAFLHRKGEQGILCVGSLYALDVYKKSCLEALGNGN